VKQILEQQLPAYLIGSSIHDWQVLQSFCRHDLCGSACGLVVIGIEGWERLPGAAIQWKRHNISDENEFQWIDAVLAGQMVASPTQLLGQKWTGG
jgi:hypothetical protein